MFSGLVEEKGRVVRVRRTAEGIRVRVAASFAGDLRRGESVSLNGVCQTVVDADTEAFEVEAVAQTLSVTTLGALRAGAEVNLERAVRAGDRLGGHFVTGHVDGVGRVEVLVRDGGGARLVVRLPEGLGRYVVPRGSIAIDGVSLTAAAVTGERVEIALIPETLRATLAGGYRAGAEVNVEADVLAKHQEKLLAARGDGEGSGGDAAGGLTEERLRELGFTERHR